MVWFDEIGEQFAPADERLVDQQVVADGQQVERDVGQRYFAQQGAIHGLALQARLEMPKRLHPAIAHGDDLTVENRLARQLRERFGDLRIGGRDVVETAREEFYAAVDDVRLRAYAVDLPLRSKRFRKARDRRRRRSSAMRA